MLLYKVPFIVLVSKAVLANVSPELSHSFLKAYYVGSDGVLDQSSTEVTNNLTPSDIVVIPQEIVKNQGKLISLGIPEIIVKSKLFNLPNYGQNDTLFQIAVPNKCKLQLNFQYNNISNNELYNETWQKQNIAKSIMNSVPFHMPHKFHLNNFQLILSKKFVTQELGANITKVQNNLLNNTKSSIGTDIFTSVLNQKNLPLLVFNFEAQNAINQTVSSNTSSYFDKFAKNWIKDINADSLFHANFCSLQKTASLGHCVAFSDDNDKILYTRLQAGHRNQTSVKLFKRQEESIEVQSETYNEKLSPGVLLGHYYSQYNSEVGISELTTESGLMDNRTSNITINQNVFEVYNTSGPESIAKRQEGNLADSQYDLSNVLLYSQEKLNDIYSSYMNLKNETLSSFVSMLQGYFVTPKNEKLPQLKKEGDKKGFTISISAARPKKYAQVVSTNNTQHKRELLFPQFNRESKSGLKVLQKRMNNTCEEITWYRVFHQMLQTSNTGLCI